MNADVILHHGLFTTLDRSNPNASAVAIKDGRFVAVGHDGEIMRFAGPDTKFVDLKGRRVLPGLIDNHTHVIRGGLNFNMELRWDGVRSLADAMDMLKRQVANTPAPQWVRVVGGFTEHQFAEKRLPTLDEINAVAPDTPVFLLHLYDRALLNGAALRAVGYTKETPNPPGGEIIHDASGNPTGLLLAKPNAGILYSTLAKGPKLPLEYQVNSTRHFMRELNRLGVTGVIDAGGGYQNYPDDYAVIQQLADENLMTVRLAYNLFTQIRGRCHPLRAVDVGNGHLRCLSLGGGDRLGSFHFYGNISCTPVLGVAGGNGTVDGDERLLRASRSRRRVCSGCLVRLVPRPQTVTTRLDDGVSRCRLSRYMESSTESGSPWSARQGKHEMKRPSLAVLLSLNAGYVDTVGFLALQGLFTAHVTGNFVTLGATLVLGTGGALAKLLALPVFCIVVMLTRLVSLRLKSAGKPVMRPLLATKLILFILAAAYAVTQGPFHDSDSAKALVMGMTLVAAMAIQNALHRVHLSKSPPTTLMTGTTTQIMLDIADIMAGVSGEDAVVERARLRRMANSVFVFAAGCGAAAGAYILSPTLCFCVPPALAALSFLGHVATPEGD